jgi:hypothetical protein
MKKTMFLALLFAVFAFYGVGWVFRENGPRAREKRSTLPRKMVRRYAAAVH